MIRYFLRARYPGYGECILVVRGNPMTEYRWARNATEALTESSRTIYSRETDLENTLRTSTNYFEVSEQVVAYITPEFFARNSRSFNVMDIPELAEAIRTGVPPHPYQRPPIKTSDTKHKIGVPKGALP